MEQRSKEAGCRGEEDRRCRGAEERWCRERMSSGAEEQSAEEQKCGYGGGNAASLCSSTPLLLRPSAPLPLCSSALFFSSPLSFCSSAPPLLRSPAPALLFPCTRFLTKPQRLCLPMIFSR